jgi:hypothetical protein
MIVDFIFPNYLDGTLNISLSMQGYSHLTKGTFTKYPTNLILILDIVGLLESLDILEIQNMLDFVVRTHVELIHCGLITHPRSAESLHFMEGSSSSPCCICRGFCHTFLILRHLFGIGGLRSMSKTIFIPDF